MVLGSVGCQSVVRRQTASLTDALARAILDHDDPATVRDGVPTLLLAIDAMIAADPASEALLIGGARLYASYATSFVDSTPRAQRLIARSRDYAERALCAENRTLCEAMRAPFPVSATALARADASDAASLYTLALSWALWISLHSDDWNAVAELPKVEAALARVTEIADDYDDGGAHMALGVLLAQRPASLGGQPELARVHFERALALSGERNLSVHVMYARYYARLVFDRELHDRLLREVLDRDPRSPGLTLSNTLAKSEAQKLLASADDYF